ncbi:MAG: aminotransferase class V-fold PLP-dependent enzyme [Candidatus Hodgkinia cicadicola]
MHNINEIRNHFRSLCSYSRPLVYWDSASTGLKLNFIVKLVDWFNLKLCANPGRASYFSSKRNKVILSAAREGILNKLNVRNDKSCVFYKSTTEAINAVCCGLKSYNGSILACPTDHNSLVGPILNSNRYVFITLDEDHVPSVRNYLILLNEDISIVMLTQSSNVLGLAIPVNLYGHLCKAKVYLLDGSQSATPIDINKINCSVYIFSAHKLCGITGIGVIIGENKLLNKMYPLILGGGNISNISMDLKKIIFENVPSRHEAGTQMIYGPSCLDITLEWRRRFLSRHVNYKFRYLWNKLRHIKQIKLYNKYTPSTRLVSFTLDYIEPDTVSMFLSKFLICIRSGTMCAPLLINRLGQSAICRISVGVHNTFKDVDALMLGFAYVNNWIEMY